MPEFLQRVADESGELLHEVRAIKVASPLTARYVPDVSLLGSPEAAGAATGYVELGVTGSAIVTPAAVLAAIAGQPIAPSSVTTTGDVTIGGKLNLGPDALTPSTATTVGAATHVLCTFALPDNSAAILRIDVQGRASTSPVRCVAFATLGSISIESGAPRGVGNANLLSVNELGLPVTVGLQSWAAGVATVAVGGPVAAIVGLASDGGTGTRVEVEGGLTASLTGVNVTIAGTSGAAAGTNGTHTAMFVDATHFDIATTWSGGSGGTVTRTDNPTITWSGFAVAAVTPAP